MLKAQYNSIVYCIKYLEREFYFVHTSREELDIVERQWLGIRKNNAITTEK
jgi:hypothetical protein